MDATTATEGFDGLESAVAALNGEHASGIGLDLDFNAPLKMNKSTHVQQRIDITDK